MCYIISIAQESLCSVIPCVQISICKVILDTVFFKTHVFAENDVPSSLRAAV
jgi:hypothetical protein